MAKVEPLACLLELNCNSNSKLLQGLLLNNTYYSKFNNQMSVYHNFPIMAPGDSSELTR